MKCKGVIILEEIFNKIIEIDRNAKEITNIEKEKKLNMDEFIESEFGIKKVVLDMEFKDEIDLQKRKYDEMLDEKKQEINQNVNEEIYKIDRKYSEKENEIIEKIITDIKKGKNIEC